MNTDSSLSKKTKVEKWDVVQEKKLLNTPVFDVHSHIASLPSKNKSGTFFTIHTPDWVNVIALTTNNQIVLVDQYRFATRDSSLEIPGGMVDPSDKDPLESAKRELEEETGFTSDSWLKLGKVSVNPALFNNHCHLYLARNCKKTKDQEPDEHEVIEVSLIALNDFFEKIRNGEIHHSLVVAAVSQYLLWEKLSLK